MPAPACAKDAIDYATSITPVLVACLALWIAFRQWEIGREKLRLDLYDRRFRIYEATLAYYQALMHGSGKDESDSFDELQRAFIRACRQSQFLFDPSSEVANLLDTFRIDSFKVIGFRKNGAQLKADPATFLQEHQKMTDALSSFESTLRKIESSMSPYLSFHRVAA